MEELVLDELSHFREQICSSIVWCEPELIQALKREKMVLNKRLKNELDINRWRKF